MPRCGRAQPLSNGRFRLLYLARKTGKLIPSDPRGEVQTLWIVPHARQQQSLEDFPNLKRWFNEIKDRPATVRAHARAAQINTQPSITEDSRAILFGRTAAHAGRAAAK